MQELINRVVQNVGLDPALAEKAVGMILAFLQKEAPEAAAEAFAAMPGAAELAAANAASEGGGGLLGGGLLGGLMGMMGGGGGVMALGQQLMGAGLGMGQIQLLSKEVFAYGRETAGEDAMGALVGSIPGLGQFV
ncbi:MAG: DUF2267 domain-containing protein [Methylobacterium sp.]